MPHRALRTLAAVFAGAFAAPSLDAMEASLTEGTFFEEILTVQEDKLKIVGSANGSVSVPYTRVDVAIDRGIALTRFLQVYHNHGTNSAGYAYTVPLEEDTTLTQFTLWDQGKRYPASIEEKTRAEQVYKKITGDEAPEMKRDPGLVRTDGRSYEMRVFPIVPGENKQIELISQQRLGIEGNGFVMRVPLRGLTEPRDARHGQVRSQRTEISIFLKDDLPIRSARLIGADAVETRLDAHRRLFRVELDPEAVQNIELRYELDLNEPSHASSWTFSQGEEDFFCARFLTRSTTVANWDEAGQRPGGSFYMGVWRDSSTTIESREADFQPRTVALEAMAYMTLTMLNQEDCFEGSFIPFSASNDEDAHSPLISPVPVVTLDTYAVRDIEKAVKESFEWFEYEDELCNAPVHDPLTHLRTALEDPARKLVYLFLHTLSADQCAKLAELIRARSDVLFLLVTDDYDLPPTLADHHHVSHFSLRDGWRSLQYSPNQGEAQILSFQEGWMDEMSGYLGIEVHDLMKFWEKLPNLGNAAPLLCVEGEAQIVEPQLFFAESHRRRPRVEGLRVIWMTGKFEGTGTAHVHLSLPLSPFGPFARWDEEESPRLMCQVVASVKLPEGNKADRFVGAFHARRLSEALNARIAMLSRSWRRTDDPPAEAEQQRQLKAARKEVVRLSREFGFISAETAFIALPEELLRKYGITPQQYAANQLYDLGRMSSGIIPEMETGILVLTGLAFLGIAARVRRSLASLRGGE